MTTRSRNIRAILALLVTSMLVAILIGQQIRHREDQYAVTMRITSVSWKFSELLYEASALASELQVYHPSDAQIAQVRRRFDLLWSRSEALTVTQIRLNPVVREALTAIERWLERSDPLIFDETPVSRETAVRLHAELHALAEELRASWIGTYLAARQGLVATAIREIKGRQTISDVLILFCIGLLVFYLIAELRASVRAHEHEARLKRAAEDGSRAKTTFLSNISHEIRTPLNAILGMVQDLRDTRLEENQLQPLSLIETASLTLLETVNNIFEIAQIDSGDKALRIVPFNPQILIREVFDTYAGDAHKNDVDMSFTVSPDVPRNVYGDPRRFVKVVDSLISNAVKYTDTGSVRVALERHAGTTPEMDLLQFSVEDTGRGIDTDTIGQVFDPFSANMSSNAQEYMGLGLGLAIASQICRIMNGTLDVTSEVGVGSCFTCRIEFRRASDLALVEQTYLRPDRHTKSHVERRASVETPVVSSQSSEPRRLRVLIVDDSPTNRLVLRRLLKDTDVDLTEAENGELAVEGFRDNQFDVVLMDIQMPILNGVEATRKIRALEHEEGRKKSKIFAVTANILPQQVDEYFRVGMDDVLPKPLNKSEIVTKLARVA